MQSWKFFPEINSLGKFSPLGNFIQLNQYEDEADFVKSVDSPNIDATRFSVYIHELQHYYDHVSTLWGVRRIYDIYEAYDAIIKRDEKMFYKLRGLELGFKRDYFLDYYTEKYNDVNGGFNNMWRYQITSGLRFSSEGNVDAKRPVPFIVFYSNEDVKISRVPISVAALIESTATHYEFNFLINEASKLESPHKENRIRSISKKFEELLYNAELTLYTVAVHIVSVTLKITNPITAYRISSIFSKIALNIPVVLFEKLKINDVFNSSREWKERANEFLENKDRGFAFYLLVLNFYDKYGAFEVEDSIVDKILMASNLPSEREMQKLIMEEIMQLDESTLLSKNIFNGQIIDKVFFGNKFREITGIAQQHDVVGISDFIRDKPYFLFGGTYFEYEELDLQPIVRKLVMQEPISMEEWFRFYTMCEKKIDDFSKICGI